MKRAPRFLVIFTAVSCAVYLLAAAGAFLLQRSMMYFPDPQLRIPDADLAGVQVVRLDTRDGEHLVAWYLPPRDDRPVILHFGGNGASLAMQSDRWRLISRAGAGFLAVGYRGYSGSSGHPTEAGLHEDARTAYAFLAARHGPQDIVIWGHSLGSGLAVRLAAERPARALILESPYNSALEMAEHRFPLLPVSLLMHDRYLSRDWIGKVHMPVMIAHGDQDAVIPFSQGERLFKAANRPKLFLRVPGGGHDDLPQAGLYDDAWRFLGVKPEA